MNGNCLCLVKDNIERGKIKSADKQVSSCSSSAFCLPSAFTSDSSLICFLSISTSVYNNRKRISNLKQISLKSNNSHTSPLLEKVQRNGKQCLANSENAQR